jgi:dihydrofolate reductase
VRKLTVASMMSLDGFYTGPRGDVEEILVFGSRTLWSDLLANGLVDELHLLVGGRIVGGRTPMFEAAPPASLRLLETRTWDGSDNVLLRYAARRGSPSD